MLIDIAPVRTVAFFLLMLVTFAGAAAAAEPAETSEGAEAPPARGRIERWGLLFGGFLVSFDTKFRWETSTPINPEIDLEEDLGLDDQLSRGRAEASLRVGRRSVLSLEYLRLRRASRQTVLRDPIIWEDELFLPGATVESDFDTDIYKFAWTWSAVSRPRFDFAITAGLSTIDFSASISGILTATGGPGDEEFRNEEEEAQIYPVPVIGLRLGGSLRHDLLLRGHVQYFRYNDDKWEADLRDALIALEYIPFEHVGFGVGYDYFSIRYRQERDNLEIRYLFEGPIVYLRLLY